MMFTKEYIEKVSKAKEIQKLCKHRLGDWFYTAKLKRQFILDDITVEHNSGMIGELVEDDNYIWLPTLEQLFEIAHIHHWLSFYERFLNEVDDEKIIDIEFKEPILDWIMENFHNKQWNPDKRKWEAKNE
jgi:hypothetical protein